MGVLLKVAANKYRRGLSWRALVGGFTLIVCCRVDSQGKPLDEAMRLFFFTSVANRLVALLQWPLPQLIHEHMHVLIVRGMWLIGQ